MYANSKGLKYLHGVEVYLTAALEPKQRDNYHTILIAKNFEGVTGDTSFDKNHNTVKTAFMMTMNNGKVTAAETVKP